MIRHIKPEPQLGDIKIKKNKFLLFPRILDNKMVWLEMADLHYKRVMIGWPIRGEDPDQIWELIKIEIKEG